MKKLFCLLIGFSLILTCSCGSPETSSEIVDDFDYDSVEYVGTYSKDLAGTTINVFNWGEYISDGSDGLIDVNKAFEKHTGVKVNYLFFDNNETMYTKLKGGGVSYDVVIPSDYMIQRMIKEDMLRKLDFSKIDNYKYIMDEYKGMYFDPNDEYSVPYNVGMVGVIYNSSEVKGNPDSWSLLWDKRYKGQILTFNNPRDCFGTAQKYLGISFNTTKKSEWKAAAKKLMEQKEVLQSYVMDEIFDKMETGEALIAPYYAGDYLLMHDNNPDLSFFYPKEGTNIFVDSVCIPKNSKNYEAALMYINFLLEPEIALANAEYICYASPNSSVVNNEEYTFYKNEILYPEEDKKPPVEFFKDMSNDVKLMYESLWEDVKLY